VGDAIVREYDAVSGGVYAVAENEVIRVILCGGSDAAALLKDIANCIPSIMSAMRTPEGISTDIPRASSRDQRPSAGTPS
jgi:hypothetical protein